VAIPGRCGLDIVHDLLVAFLLFAAAVHLALVLLGLVGALVEEELAPVRGLVRLLMIVAVADALGHFQLRSVIPMSA